MTWNTTASADPAYPPYPPSTGCTVSTTTTNAGPGDSVTFVGTGFAANQTVTLGVPAATAALGSVKTGGNGSFSGTFTWPASVNGSSALVQASAPSATCSFTMYNGHPGTKHSSNASGGSGLSSTGFAALTATTIAIVLLGSGALFLGLARRKRA